MNKKNMQFYLDVRGNTPDTPFYNKQETKILKEKFISEIPDILKRGKKVKQLLTTNVAGYLPILRQAKEVYSLGFYYSTVAMIGIAAEKFSIDLSSKLKFKVNEHSISKKELFGREVNQFKRLRLLKKAELLNQSAFDKLDRIRDVRNNYIHPKAKINPEADSLELLNLMIDMLIVEFSEEWSIKNGKLVKK